MGRQYAITQIKESYDTADWFGWDFIERMYPDDFTKELRAAMGLPVVCF